MRLVFVTQRVDPDDPILGATVAMIAALAARFDEIVVLTDNAVPGALPANCRIRTFAAPTRVGRGFRFARALIAELVHRPRPVAVVAHMCPIYAVLAAPLARPIGVRVLLWYAQWHRTRTLELAAKVSTNVVSVAPDTVPIGSRRVVAIGHGIDVSHFTCGDRGPEAPFIAVALGRYSDSKGLPTIVRAVGRARAEGLDIHLHCYGTATMSGEPETLARIRDLVGELELGSSVVLGGPLPRTEVPALLARASALVNNTRSGAPDKVVFEACAACVPVLVSSPPLRSLVQDLEPSLFFATDDVDGLARSLAALAETSASTRAAIGATLRARVVASHSTDSWADAIALLAMGQRPTTSP